jgi:hypothetical protein
VDRLDRGDIVRQKDMMEYPVNTDMTVRHMVGDTKVLTKWEIEDVLHGGVFKLDTLILVEKFKEEEE